MGTLYESIKSLCDEKGVKGGKMCVDLGISKSTMTDLKSGRRTGISLETAQKIASFFGVSVGHLLGIEGSGAVSDNNAVNLDQVDVAFYGDFKELSDEDKETVRDMVRLMRQRRADNQRK